MMLSKPLFFVTLLLLPSILLGEEDLPKVEVKEDCSLDEDGNQVCTITEIVPVEEEETIDYLFPLKGERFYNCSDEFSQPHQCVDWAAHGECLNNPGFMILNCAKSCGYCALQEPEVRCQRHPKAVPAVSKPGEINAMFERIMSDFPQHTPKALSRDPWVVELHDVFTREEADRLIELGGTNFKRSVDAGKMGGKDAQFEEIVSDARTSFTDWCTYGRGCWSDPLVQNIAKRAENITMVPMVNSEFFQVLRYNVGQYYVKHHDYIYGHLDLPIGPRLYTFFLYLGGPESGGGTKFNQLGITVEPEFGKVAIWPSVLDSDPMKKDPRTQHEALPVEKGVKFGANLWLHMFNFHGPYQLMCTG